MRESDDIEQNFTSAADMDRKVRKYRKEYDQRQKDRKKDKKEKKDKSDKKHKKDKKHKNKVIGKKETKYTPYDEIQIVDDHKLPKIYEKFSAKPIKEKELELPTDVPDLNIS